MKWSDLKDHDVIISNVRDTQLLMAVRVYGDRIGLKMLYDLNEKTELEHHAEELSVNRPSDNYEFTYVFNKNRDQLQHFLKNFPEFFL